jgi:hypothetical protein
MPARLRLLYLAGTGCTRNLQTLQMPHFEFWNMMLLVELWCKGTFFLISW